MIFMGAGMNLQAKIDRIKNNLDAQSYTVAAGEADKYLGRKRPSFQNKPNCFA